MKWNKFMAVLSAGFTLAALTSNVFAEEENYWLPLGITNVPLSFSGTLYLRSGAETNLYNYTISSNVVKHAGNLERAATYTTNYTEHYTNGYAAHNYVAYTYGVSNFVASLNSDPTFTSVYGTVPAKAQFTYNVYSGEFWLTTTNGFAFDLSTNWWVYSWTNVYYTGRMYDTNIFTVSNTFASSVPAVANFSGYYSDSCGNYYPITNTYGHNSDFAYEASGGRDVETAVFGFTNNEENLTSGSFNAVAGYTNIEVGEIYLSTGTNLQLALVGPSIIIGNQTASTNKLVGLNVTAAATSQISFNASLSGTVGTINYQNSYSSECYYHYNGNFDGAVVTHIGEFTGAVTGSKTASTQYRILEDN